MQKGETPLLVPSHDMHANTVTLQESFSGQKEGMLFFDRVLTI